MTERINRVEIGFGALWKTVNPQLFVIGMSIIIAGIALMMWSTQMTPTGEQFAERPGGFIYISPFPFVFSFNSPETAILIPVIVAVIALPIIMILLVLRNFAKVR